VPWLTPSLFEKQTGKNTRQDRKSIGEAGRLTSSKFDKLQVYCGKAIIAIWYHTKSTDDNPDRDLCPPSADSWCGFQRDLENGTSDYQQIPDSVADVIPPTFEAFSDESLLSSCLHAGPQNQNKAINAMIWQPRRSI